MSVSNILEVLVIGAGPAGIATMLCLADQFDYKYECLGWIDPEFCSGRIGKYYRNVPSNTKVDLFIKFATLTRSGKDMIKLIGVFDPFQNLSDLDPDRECRLGYMADLLDAFTQCIWDGCEFFLDNVSVLHYSTKDALWRAETTGGNTIYAKKVFLCTGSRPAELSAHQSTSCVMLPLDSALDCLSLGNVIDPSKDSVCVVGSSHSAVIVLKNLVDLGVKKIKMLYRHPPKFAKYLKDGSIQYDNTGLKGVAAEWARKYLTENNDYVKSVKLLKETEEETRRKEIATCNKVIYAIGYVPNELPKVVVDDVFVGIKFDHENGTFKNAPNLYGCGIAFPQKVIDKSGDIEFNVGMWKFITFVQSIIKNNRIGL